MRQSARNLGPPPVEYLSVAVHVDGVGRAPGVPSLMTRNDLDLDRLRLEVARMAALDPASFATRVPTCPGWDVGHVVAHTSWVHRYFAYVLRQPEGTQARRSAVPLWPDDVDVLSWLYEGVDDLIAAMRATPSSKTVWSALGVYPASLVGRRVVHETAIHRWDAQAATGDPDGFDPSLAVDGIDEVLELWVPLRFDYAAFNGTGQTIHLHATDVAADWLITVNAETTEWRSTDEPADVTVQGAVGDLYLLSWNRVDPAHLDTRGDTELLARWQAAACI